MKKVLSILDKLGFSVILASATMLIVGALIMLKTLPENMDYHAVMSAPVIGASVEALEYSMEYQKSHDLTDEHKFGMAIFWTGMTTACVSGIVIAIWWKIEEFREMFKGPKELSTNYKE